MLRHHIYMIRLLSLLLLLSAPVAKAQTPSPEALAAAKELLNTIHITDQFSAIVPGVIQNMKPAIVQGRPEVARQYDQIAPILLEGFRARLSEFSEAVAIIYASNFSAEDLTALTAFYKTAAGQRLLQKLPTVTQETMLAGRKFGRSVGEDAQKQMIEELRKRGINL